MKIISVVPEFTFDDVLLLPNSSTFLPGDEEKVIDLRTKITKNISLDIPLISAPMPGVTEAEMAIAIGSLGGIGFLHHFQSFDRQLEQARLVKAQKVKVAACVYDLSEKGVNHVAKLLKVGVDLISVESGHAQNQQVIEFIKTLKKTFRKIEISVALVVTADATKDIIRAGADSIRVGIGGGSHCTTRLVTGIGRPQLSAVMECVKVAKKYHVPVISDTGIKYAGDIPKAIAFGASAVMIGGLFAGTDQAPGEVIQKRGKTYKMTWGMCTDTAQRHSQVSQILRSHLKEKLRSFFSFSQQEEKHKLFEEGVEGLVEYKGSVKPIIRQLLEGTRRSMWYMGAKNLAELEKKARVVFVSDNTHTENMPRI